MTQVLSVDRQQMAGTALAEEVLHLDLLNMAPLFADLGQERPVEKRRLSFKHPGTIIFARDATGRLVGYLEFGQGWEGPGESYVCSIQIATEHRRGPLLLKLLRHAISDCRLPDGWVVKTHVQENNSKAIKLLEQIGFEIDRVSKRNGTLSASMTFPPTKWPHFRLHTWR